ncbi:MAG: class I adenylate-forming enzyme family protein [Candidatus Omnitrophota bacterium]
MDIIKLLETVSKNFPEKAAIIYKEKVINFLELKEIVSKLSSSLKNLGIKRQDKIAVYLPNCPQYIYSYLSLWCLGVTVVPLDYMLTEDELVSCLTHSEARFLIARDKENLSLSSVKQRSPCLENIILISNNQQGYLSFEKILNEGRGPCLDTKINDSDYSIIFYTSGTTGKPKGVLVSYKQLEAPAKHMRYFIKEFQEDEIEVAAVPFSHLGGLVYILISLFWGVSLIIMERFSPLDFLKNVERYRATSFFIVPSMYYAFLSLKELGNINLSSLRWINCFGAPSSPEVLRRFRQYCPQAVFYHGWGMTETNAPTTAGFEKAESVGRPAPGFEIKIFSAEGGPLPDRQAGATGGDDNDKEVPAGSVGEIVVRGWIVTDGYYKDPELTRETMRSGWFHTGDLGKFDEEGYLYIMGRRKEMIKVGGEIVFEPEIEEVIHRHPDISEVAVIGVADKLRGEVPKAFVVLKKDLRVKEEDLRQFCRQHLANFKIPHYFEFRDSLPKNRSGKIDKEFLRKEAQAK